MIDMYPSDHESLDDVFARIAETANNEVYDIYSQGRGPLTIDQLDVAARKSNDFRDAVSTWDWPNLSDSVIEPAHEYASGTDFVYSLRHSTIKDEYGHDVPNPHYLGNLGMILSAEPIDTFDPSNLYGSYPIVHRANVIAPDLFASIRDLHLATGRDELTYALDALESGAGDVVCEQLFKAFKILGRLVKTTDATIQIEVTAHNPKQDPDPVTNLQDYLTT